MRKSKARVKRSTFKKNLNAQRGIKEGKAIGSKILFADNESGMTNTTSHKSSYQVKIGRFGILLPIIWVFLFLVTIVWYFAYKFRTVMGDDLQIAQFFSHTPFLKATILNAGGNKYRPVFNILEFFTIRLLHAADLTSFFYFNIAVEFLVALCLFYLIKHISRGNKMLALLVSLLFVTSRFAYYNMYMLVSPLEGFALLFFALLFFVSIKLMEGCDKKFALFAIMLFFADVFTHERYLAVAPFLITVFMLAPQMTRVQKVMFSSGTVLIVLLNIFIKRIIFNTIFLEGTGGVSISFKVPRIASFIGAGFLNLLNINAGPAYLNGIEWNHVPLCVDLLIVISIVMVMSILYLYYAKRLGGRTSSIPLVLLELMILLLLVASITIRQEPRWLYAPYLVWIVLLAYWLYNGGDYKHLRNIILFIFVGVTILANYFYRSSIPNIFFVYSEKIANSMYDQSIREYGQNLSSYKIYIVDNQDVNWALLGSTLFQFYLNNPNYNVSYVANPVEDVDPKAVQGGRVLVFDYDASQHVMVNITKEVAYRQSLEQDSTHEAYNLIDLFKTSQIGPPSAGRVSAPSGKGAFVNPWSIDSISQTSATVLSGFTDTFSHLSIDRSETLKFSTAMPLTGGVGARAVVYIESGDIKKAVFTKDLLPGSTTWYNVNIPLHDYIGKRISIVFTTLSPSGDQTAAWVAYGYPRIVFDK